MERKDSASLSAFLVTRSRFVTFWRKGHRQAARDLRIRWIRSGFWLLVLTWIMGLILALTMISLIADGSGFFQITLGAGNMNFTQVKTIDIVWGIVVGRGGQAVLALIFWRVFANYVTTSMEVMPVTPRTYRTVFLQNGSLLTAIPRTIRGFTLRHRLKYKIAIFFMVTTMKFIRLFPTFASAMTGYNGNFNAFVNTMDNNYIPFESFSFAFYVVRDGWRINLGGNYLVTGRTRRSTRK
ncbi:hypothetical protein EJ02DRAFT_474953 [Clathrospora elynae]|uniref:Uncharacterized protein n=1 Tax=Clathrospora elynae TaxID=706981 RepID=A0A6A5T9U9_9PLEO|nr:hypothetical protein EJ02DRAFT_474953 [Clathrospora elynae]